MRLVLEFWSGILCELEFYYFNFVIRGQEELRRSLDVEKYRADVLEIKVLKSLFLHCLKS